MQRDAAYLLDILDSARLILEYVSGKTRDDFVSEIALQDQVMRRPEIAVELPCHMPLHLDAGLCRNGSRRLVRGMAHQRSDPGRGHEKRRPAIAQPRGQQTFPDGRSADIADTDNKH